MQSWGFSLGRWMGVEVRLHAFFFFLMSLCLYSGYAIGADGARGLGLWLTVLAAVAVRETARALAAAWLGLEMNGMILLPTGGLLTFANTDTLTPTIERRLAPVGPLANLLTALILAGLMLAVAPGVALATEPWISVGHLLRALVWSNALLGALHLLPAVPLDGGRIFRSIAVASRGYPAGSKAAGGLSRLISVALALGGAVLHAPWLIATGVFLLLSGTLERQTVATADEIDSIRMRDVMLEDFNTLSGADTLEEALHRALHATQDVFPVVRSGNLVGAVSRQVIVNALEAGGNGYVQGIMTRALTTASPNDSVVLALRRMTGRDGAQLVPVVEDGRVVGIVTPQNLSYSTRLLARQRRIKRSAER